MAPHGLSACHAQEVVSKKLLVWLDSVAEQTTTVTARWLLPQLACETAFRIEYGAVVPT